MLSLEKISPEGRKFHNVRYVSRLISLRMRNQVGYKQSDGDLATKMIGKML